MHAIWILVYWVLGYLPHKTFRLGQGHVTRYTLFECKWLFSIYLHQIATRAQDRFHTHAFNAVVLVLRGGYTEVQKAGLTVTHHEFQSPCVRYVPRLMNHKLLRAQPGTLSLLFTGPYAELWTEETDEGVFRLLTTGQRELVRLRM